MNIGIFKGQIICYKILKFARSIVKSFKNLSSSKEKLRKNFKVVFDHKYTPKFEFYEIIPKVV